MSKIQKWNIKDGERCNNQDIQSVLGQDANLSVLYHDGYAGAKYLNTSDNSIWEEIYIWENGERDVTTVKLSNTSFHVGHRAGSVFLDSKSRFISDKLPFILPPPSEAVYSSKHYPVSFGQGFDACACCYRIQNTSSVPL